MKKIFFYSIILITFLSCEKEVNITLPEEEDKLVVEGSIFEGDYATVILTKSMAYFAPVDTQSLFKSLVLNAKVEISDGTNSEVLQISYDPNFFPPTVYKGKNIKGQTGKTYQLTINVNNKIYTSSTTIPKSVELDSLWFKPTEYKPDLGYVWMRLSDPSQLGNYYRLFLKRQGYTTYRPNAFGSVFEDRFINGKTLDLFARRPDPSNFLTDAEKQAEDRYFFKKGDSIYVRLCSIDRAAFKFFDTYEVALQSNGNPFASPTLIQTNIKGGALGVWCGYGYKDLMIVAK